MKRILCDITTGESTGAKKCGLQRWWWQISVTGCENNSDNPYYRSKRAAIRNAKLWAARLNLDVESVSEYGARPEDG